MAFDADVLDPLPPTKASLLANYNYQDSNVWNNCKFAVTTGLNQFNGFKYVRAGAASGGDLKTYDAGQFVFATSGLSTGTNIGDLEVSYVCHLRVPQSTGSGSSVANTFVMRATGGNRATPALGSVQVNLGSIATILAASNQVQFNALGTYLVNLIASIRNGGVVGSSRYGIDPPAIGSYTGYTVRDQHCANATWLTTESANTPQLTTGTVLVDVLNIGALMPFVVNMQGSSGISTITDLFECRVTPHAAGTSYT